MAALIEELVERAFYLAALGEDEASSGLYTDVIKTWSPSCRHRLAIEVAESEDYGQLMRVFELAIAAGGAASLDDANLATMLRAYIRHADHVAGSGVVTRMRRVANSHGFSYPRPLQWLWWTILDDQIQTIDARGQRSPSSTLTGTFRLHANFVPELADLDNKPALVNRCIDLLADTARIKKMPQLAAALTAQRLVA